MKKLIRFLSGVPMCAVSGVAVIESFLLPKLGVHFIIDPAWIAVLISGLPLLHNAVSKLIFKKGIQKISSALLITFAMIAAILIGDVFAAGEVAFIMALGEILEDKTTERAKRGLQKLISLKPVTANRVTEDGVEAVLASEIQVGDIVRILPGETVPVDGVIVSGNSSLDQSVLTGESLPVDKSAGDAVYAGSVNRFGSMDVHSTAVSEDTSLSRLIRLVKEADENKAPIQRIADKWASWLVPTALLIAIIAYFVTKDIERAVTVLVVFCPCALVLATPTAIMAAIGQAAKKGIVIKSGEALELMSKMDVVALDKTGTLTRGEPVVSDITLSEGIAPSTLLSFAAAVESKSEHPLAQVIVAYALENGIIPSDCSGFQLNCGLGVQAFVDGHEVRCGSEVWMLRSQIRIPEKISESLRLWQSEGKANVVVSVNREVLGAFALSDAPKENVSSILRDLQSLSVSPMLLTGDSMAAAKYLADKVGIQNVHAGLLPEQKVQAIYEAKEKGSVVCMVGDGVNDAPALKTADVGIAMGALGSDLAVESCDIVLLDDDLGKLPYLKRLSKATVSTIRFGIGLSLFINFAAIVLSFFALLTPTTGALVHNAGSLIVILIASLLYDRKIPM